jgi:hypothetical protein
MKKRKKQITQVKTTHNMSFTVVDREHAINKSTQSNDTKKVYLLKLLVYLKNNK